MQEKNKFSLVLFIALSCIFATFLDLSLEGHLFIIAGYKSWPGVWLGRWVHSTIELLISCFSS